jgi:hypothetical protein
LFYFKCCHTSNYGFSSITKRFINRADRSSQLIQSCSYGSDTDDSYSTQLALNKTVVKQEELKDLYAKRICGDIRANSIVEDNCFEELAQPFI